MEEKNCNHDSWTFSRERENSNYRESPKIIFLLQTSRKVLCHPQKSSGNLSILIGSIILSQSLTVLKIHLYVSQHAFEFLSFSSSFIHSSCRAFVCKVKKYTLFFSCKFRPARDFKTFTIDCAYGAVWKKLFVNYYYFLLLLVHCDARETSNVSIYKKTITCHLQVPLISINVVWIRHPHMGKVHKYL